jgi:hypothetical protein
MYFAYFIFIGARYDPSCPLPVNGMRSYAAPSGPHRSAGSSQGFPIVLRYNLGGATHYSKLAIIKHPPASALGAA